MTDLLADSQHQYNRSPPSAGPTDSPNSTMNRSELTSKMVSSFQVARIHRYHEKPVSCLDFSHDGATLVSCGPDDTVQIYNCLDGYRKNHIPVQKYGAQVIRFIKDQAHSPPTVITASSSTDHKLRALDIEHRRYARYFEGHTAPAVSISTSPAGPDFLSTSRDSYVTLWDCRSEDAKGRVRAVGTPVAAYDPKGLIFGVAYNTPNLKTTVKLYDARQYSDGPFLEFPIENASDAPPSCLKFSSDGEYFILVNADVSATVSVYDAYKGGLFRTFTGHRNASGIPLEASFSPDSAFISSGSDDGSIFMWDLQSKQLLMEKKEIHAMPSSCAIWNPVYALFASACQNVALWLPQDESPEHY